MRLRNREFEGYVLLAFLLILITSVGWLGYRSYSETQYLTKAVDVFYEGPYHVSIQLSDFREQLEMFNNRFTCSDEVDLGVNTDKLQADEVQKCLEDIEQGLTSITDHFYTHNVNSSELSASTKSLIDLIRTNLDATDYLEVNEALREEVSANTTQILRELSVYEMFARLNADSIFQSSISDRSTVLKRIGSSFFYIEIVLLGLALMVGFLLVKKNKEITNKQNLFKDLIIYSPIPILVHKNGEILLTSNALHSGCGYSRKELRTINDWVKLADAEKESDIRLKYIQNLYESLEEPQDEGIFKVKHKNGTVVKWHFYTAPLSDGSLITIAMDVTQEREAFKKLNLYKKAIEQSPVSIIITNPEGIIEYVNKYFTTITGYSKKEAIGKKPNLLKSGKHDESLYKNLWQTITSGKTWTGEVINKSKDGTLFWETSIISPMLDEDGEIKNYIAVKEDITHRKNLESEARQRERLLNDTQEITRTGGWEYDIAKDKMYWTKSLYSIHGLSTDFDEVHITETLSCYEAHDRQKFLKAFHRCKNEGVDFDLVLHFTDFTGLQKWVRTKTRPVWNDEGKIEKLIGIVSDVTEETLREQSLLENEKRFRAVINSFNDIVFTLDTNMRFNALYGNWIKKTAFSEKELIGKTIIDLVGYEEGKIHERNNYLALKGETVRYITESSKFDASGEKLHFETTLSPLLNHNEEIVGILGVSRNVTQQIFYQELLKETKERYQMALSGTQAGTWDWEIQTGNILLNDRWAEIEGYDLSELQPITIETTVSLVHPDDIKLSEEALAKHFKGDNEIYDCKIRMKHKSGHYVWVWDRGKVVESDENGQPVRMVGTHVDISAWMHAEELLKVSEKKYRDLFEKSADASFLYKNGSFFDCNEAAEKLFGYSRDEIIGMTPLDISPEFQPDGKLSSQVIDKNFSHLLGNKYVKFEAVRQHKKGKLIPVEVMLSTLKDVDGDEIVMAVMRDITERKVAEEKLLDSLSEKEILLAEVHHRVKNNLAIVSGLLQLQVISNRNPELKETLTKSVNRIKSIALIHDQLYNTNNFNRINMVDNIKAQTQNLLEMYTSELNTEIDIRYKLDDVSLDINQAIPFGLLINEVVTNALKHGFTDNDFGIITITLKEIEDTILLEIEDSGVGFNAESDFKRNDTLGNVLIETFVSQLEGQMKINGDYGTRFEVRFKSQLKKGIGAYINV